MEYILVQGIRCVTAAMVDREHGVDAGERFRKWMQGQTHVRTSEGEAAFYAWDYRRWLRQGQRTTQGTDWD